MIIRWIWVWIFFSSSLLKSTVWICFNGKNVDCLSQSWRAEGYAFGFGHRFKIITLYCMYVYLADTCIFAHMEIRGGGITDLLLVGQPWFYLIYSAYIPKHWAPIHQLMIEVSMKWFLLNPYFSSQPIFYLLNSRIREKKSNTNR